MTSKNNSVTISISLTPILLIFGVLAGAYIGLLLSFDTQSHSHLLQYGRSFYVELFFTRFGGFMERADLGPLVAFILGGGIIGGTVGLILASAFTSKD